MKTKFWCIVVLLAACLAALPVWAQTNFPAAKGDDAAQSFGAFWILIEPPYRSLFTGCAGYNPTTHVLQSPWLYEPNTSIGRSAPLNEGTPQDHSGVQVGSANTIVKDSDMKLPAGFTPAPAGAHEVHTEIRHLNMVGGGAGVRAGVCYSHAGCSPAPAPPSNRISPGEVITNGGTHDFPARSFFNVFAQIDIPHCGGFPATIVFNSKPLLVQTPSISSFPPSGAVYMHDSSSAVSVKFLAAGGAGRTRWERNDRLGCVILAGHGVIPSFGHAELQQTPSVVPVALQQPNKEEKMKRPNKDEEEKKFRAHMMAEHQREGGKHTDCPKDDDDDGHDHGGKDHDGKDH
jgi:hypothetical protein